MVDYSLLTVGLACSQRNNYLCNECYEIVKEDFFDEISDSDFLYEKKKENTEDLTEEEKEKLEEAKKLKKKIRRRRAAIAAAIVTIGAAIVGLRKARKIAPEKVEKLTKQYNKLKKDKDELFDWFDDLTYDCDDRANIVWDKRNNILARMELLEYQIEKLCKIGGIPNPLKYKKI